MVRYKVRRLSAALRQHLGGLTGAGRPAFHATAPAPAALSCNEEGVLLTARLAKYRRRASKWRAK